MSYRISKEYNGPIVPQMYTTRGDAYSKRRLRKLPQNAVCRHAVNSNAYFLAEAAHAYMAAYADLSREVDITEQLRELNLEYGEPLKASVRSFKAALRSAFKQAEGDFADYGEDFARSMLDHDLKWIAPLATLDDNFNPPDSGHALARWLSVVPKFKSITLPWYVDEPS